MASRLVRTAMMTTALLLTTERALATSTTIHFVNECEQQVQWFDGSDSKELQVGESFALELAAGDNAAYRAGVTNDATRELILLLCWLVEVRGEADEQCGAQWPSSRSTRAARGTTSPSFLRARSAGYDCSLLGCISSSW